MSKSTLEPLKNDQNTPKTSKMTKNTQKPKK